ncbi:MAG: RNA polymerase sigma factor [Candidatus Aminicenantes bacterium]|nr:RNA polymerase sigma factor [Candidatus Aminicenantes bacterium]
MSIDLGPGFEDRLAAGEAEAFRKLVEAYKRRFYGLAYEFTRNGPDAEDVSQAAFIKVFRSIRTFRKGANLNSWLYRIVVNAAIDHLRKRSFFPASFSGAVDVERTGPSEDPARRAEAALLREKIDRALEAVSEREKAAFLLRHDHGLDLKEIAEVLGVSLGAVKSYLFRSVRKIQKEVEYV